jgi:hypothetical protein
MSQDYFVERNAASVVPEGAFRAYAPQRACQEMLPQCAIIIPLIEIGSQVVPLEVGEDVPDQERISVWFS